MIRDTAWMDSALCKEIGPHPFDLRKGDRITPARKVCRACPVRIECLDYALTEFDRETDVGVWGGTSVNERREMRKRA